jgi:UDP-2,3-diacylglucosamine hydrolase
LAYLSRNTRNALFVLGDLMEVWVGDDVLDHPQEGVFWRQMVTALRQAATTRPMFFMQGNRDFLTGPRWLTETGLQPLQDPTVLVWQKQRWLLSHGDAWCLDDRPYQAFRQEVRQPGWIQHFLARPLSERLILARQMRDTSEAQKRHAPPDTPWADVDAAEAERWLDQTRADHLIHGHTHVPATHILPSGRLRWVLSDWCADAKPPRLQILRLQAGEPGPRRMTLNPDGSAT